MVSTSCVVLGEFEAELIISRRIALVRVRASSMLALSRVLKRVVSSSSILGAMKGRARAASSLILRYGSRRSDSPLAPT